MYRIVSKDMLTPTICRMRVEAPRLAAAAQPGQFLIVRADEQGERIPLTISDYDKAAGTVTIVTQRIGASTSEICSYEEGDCFADVVGPLGIPSDFTEMSAEELAGKKYVFIAGGVGTAPVYPQVKWLHELGVKCDVITGAKTKDMLILEEEMSAVAGNFYPGTDDGSYGNKGLITQGVEEVINREKVDMCVTIGPAVMMKFVSLLTKKYEIPTVASLNTIMVDGTGMCGACRVTVGGQTKFVCVDGPEFDAHQVDFDEMMMRLSAYKDAEVESFEKFKPMHNA